MRLYLGLLFGIVFFLISGLVFAQKLSGLVVRGRIFDPDGNPVEAAHVALLKANDSTFVGGVSSGKAGEYVITAESHSGLILKVSYVGLKNAFLNIKSTEKRLVVHDFHMKADSKVLDETVVTAEAPPVVVIGDTVCYSAAAIPVHKGAVLEDIIKKIPGASLSDNGKIVLNGKEIKGIMVDGKEFFAGNPEIALKNLPAEAVKNIRTYDRKSDMARVTGIDDNEENNVIDVTVHEDMKKGWFGNLIAGAGNKGKYEGGGMMNHFRGDIQISLTAAANNTNGNGLSDISGADVGYGGNLGAGEGREESVGVNISVNRKKIEFYSDLSYRHDRKELYQKDSRETYLTAGSSFETKQNDRNDYSNNLRGSVRLVYRPDSMTDIHFTYRAGMNYVRTYSDRVVETSDNFMMPVNYSMAHISGSGDNMQMNGSLMINRKFNRKGRNLTLDIRFNSGKRNAAECTLSDTYFYLNDSLALIDRLTENSGRSSGYNIGVSYSEPLWQNAFLRFSYKYNGTSSASLRNPVYDIGVADNTDILSNDTYSRSYRHNAEVRLQSRFRKVTFNVSLGALPTMTSTKVERGINAGSERRQTSLDYQPAANVVVRIDNRRQFRLTYHGRSSTPSIMDLQEVKDISDPMNLQFGNPNLKNTFSQSVVVGYSGYNPGMGSNIMMHLMANNTLNGITYRTVYNPNNGVRSTHTENINGNWLSNAMLTFNTPLKNRKINIGSNIYINYSHRVGFSLMLDEKKESAFSISDNVNVGNRIFASYRETRFDCYLSAGYDAGLSRNNLADNAESTTHVYVVNANTNISLPWDMFLSTDINFTSRRGFSDGYDRNTVMWNAQISKNFLKNRQATVRIKFYDILRMQSNTFRTVSFDYTQDTETNMVGSYFIIHFVYRLNMMNGNSRHRAVQRRTGMAGV